MSEDSDKTTETPEVEAPVHAADTLPPESEDEGLSDAELSAKRGLSHRDGPAVRVTARQRIAARQEAMRKEAKAP